MLVITALQIKEGLGITLLQGVGAGGPHNRSQCLTSIAHGRFYTNYGRSPKVNDIHDHVIGCNWVIQADKTIDCAPGLNLLEYDRES